ncbi:MAG: hypothetical protein HYX60_05190 [Legionella longbeachae]|nr:hypothetical protein [Legionella longbeachae]
MKNIIGEIIVENGIAFFKECNDYALIVRNSTAIYKKNNSRKKIGREQLKEANKEYEKKEIFSYLNLEKPVERTIVQDKKTFNKIYTVMKKFTNISLSDILHNPCELAKLSIKILEAYQNQIAKVGYVHLDVKLDNLLIEKNINGEYEVYFIDIDTTTKRNEKRPRSGTPTMMAPEFYPNNFIRVKRSADIYSLGMLLILLWNPVLSPSLIYKAKNIDELFKFNEENLKTYSHYNPYLFSENKNKKLKYHYLHKDKITEDSKHLLTDTFKKMTHIIPKERGRIKDIIKNFNKIYDDLSQEKLKLTLESN